MMEGIYDTYNDMQGFGNTRFNSPVLQFGEQQPIKVCIVLPTYNEASTIARVLHLLQHYARASYHKPVDLHVLVVDDSSPDGTADIVRKHQERNPNIHLLSRPKKEGLGAAYIAGMQHALHTINPDVIVEMDADLQHNPADAFRLTDDISEDVDMVIGSRYVQGGAVPKTWGRSRKLMSSMSNLVTKMLLQHDGIKDYTGGFRAIKADILEKIDLNSLGTKGYAFQAVLLDSVIQQGGTVKEIPITFSVRAAGSSKMRMRDLVEGGALLLKRKIRTPKIPQSPVKELR